MELLYNVRFMYKMGGGYFMPYQGIMQEKT